MATSYKVSLNDDAQTFVQCQIDLLINEDGSEVQAMPLLEWTGVCKSVVLVACGPPLIADRANGATYRHPPESLLSTIVNTTNATDDIGFVPTEFSRLLFVLDVC